MPVTNSTFLKSNVYLMLFFLIVTVGAHLNEKYRLQEFLLKKRMESVNTILEDYQKRLKRSYQRMEHLAIVDPLTGVYNRTYLMQWLSKEVHKDQKAKDVFSLIMYDFDQFKEINDLAGHQMGDHILQKVAEVVQEHLDDKSPIFRYGGDEFCVILPGLDLPRAVRLAEKIRKSIEVNPDLLVKFSPTESFHVTISMGVITEYSTGTVDQDYLIRWADTALLESKRAGRNCIHVFDPDERKIKRPDRWLETEGRPESEISNA
ncbi:MAG: GGDEF domain-containing protein [Candidatus Omnitrophica bacterium]|nr:GGDEF domain-containing protein [Candidatus Omnitrophota bacterium]